MTSQGIRTAATLHLVTPKWFKPERFLRDIALLANFPAIGQAADRSNVQE